MGSNPAEMTERGLTHARGNCVANYNGRQRSIFRTQVSEARARNGMPFMSA
jgi:hypothetical protein